VTPRANPPLITYLNDVNASVRASIAICLPSEAPSASTLSMPLTSPKELFWLMFVTLGATGAAAGEDHVDGALGATFADGAPPVMPAAMLPIEPDTPARSPGLPLNFAGQSCSKSQQACTS
jgi:hypothetical protein